MAWRSPAIRRLLNASSPPRDCRALDASPKELDRHRLALRVARQNRPELISRSTDHLMARMDAAAGTANTKHCCTRPRSGLSSTRGTMLRPLSPSSTGGSGSNAAGRHWRRDDGWTRPRRSRPRHLRPEWRAGHTAGAVDPFLLRASSDPATAPHSVTVCRRLRAGGRRRRVSVTITLTAAG